MEITFEVNISTDFICPDVKRKRLPGEPRLKPGPSPSKRPRKNQHRKGPTRLRKDRPLQTEISHDIWESILVWCSLEQLLKIRTLCKTFHGTLSSDRVWKQARIHQFGANHPDPPDGLKEMEYADLLVAVGCQNPDCTEKATRRTYWAFRRRWCEKCNLINLTRERRAKDEIRDYDASKKCIPFAMYDSWNHYQWAGNHENPPLWAGMFGAQTPTYSKFDIKRYNKRYDAFMQRDPAPTEKEKSKWLSEQESANDKYMTHLQKIEAWVMDDMKQREKERIGIRVKRAEFFKSKASQMDPPLAAEALQLCPSYEKSAQISRLPSQKSWNILHEKLVKEREAAETRAAKQSRARYHRLYRIYLAERLSMTSDLRQPLDTPEQKLVLRLADQVIHNLLIDPQGTNEMDIVNVVLRRVYDAFQKLPDDDKPKTSQGPYRLIMDDARLVYRQRILPLTRCFQGEERQKKVLHLCCPSAHCQGMKDGFFEFEDLIDHLENTHPGIEGFDYLSLSCHYMVNSYNRSVWFTLEWPRNLPMRAVHQLPQDNWDVDEEVPYKAAPTPGRPLLEDLMEKVVKQHHFRSTRTGDFSADTILQAALALSDISIYRRYRSNIALELLRTRLLSVKDSSFGQPDSQTIMSSLEAADLDHVFPDQCCLRCRQSRPYLHHAFTANNFAELVRHYFMDHLTIDPTSTGLITVPDTSKLDGENTSLSAASSAISTPSRKYSPRKSDCSLPAFRDAFADLDGMRSSSISGVNGGISIQPWVAGLLNGDIDVN